MILSILNCSMSYLFTFDFISNILAMEEMVCLIGFHLLLTCMCFINYAKEEESGRGKNVISPRFSLLNRLQPVRGVLWPNFTEPKCLLAKCFKVGVRQQRTITLDVQQTIVPNIYEPTVLENA